MELLLLFHISIKHSINVRRLISLLRGGPRLISDGGVGVDLIKLPY